MMTPTVDLFSDLPYWPLWNAQIAFKDFKPLLGVEASPLVGFQTFRHFFQILLFHPINYQHSDSQPGETGFGDAGGDHSVR